MLILNLVKELKTWSLRNCENVNPVEIKKTKKSMQIWNLMKKLKKCFKTSYNPNFFYDNE
jgi:hypothetical protein